MRYKNDKESNEYYGIIFRSLSPNCIGTVQYLCFERHVVSHLNAGFQSKVKLIAVAEHIINTLNHMQA